MAKDLIPSTHPLTPPLTEEEWSDWLRLLRSRRVGVSTFFRLMNEHGTAASALEALPGIAAQAGVEDYRPCPPAEIPDPPPMLWCLGKTELLKKPAIAVVGARNASSLGTRMARKLAGELGEAGFVVVSGLARGVDAAAHAAALETGTVAVMAGGVDIVYPTENTVLAQEIEEQGLRVSETPMSITPQARHFPRRNRIISGLVRAVVVVEAAAKSGSLITARTALEQGREVLAVPGHPFDPRGSGCNMLIRDGAALVRDADDVFAALETPAAKPEPKAEAPRPARVLTVDTAELHRQILDRLGASPVPEDQLIRDISAPPGQVSPEITTLELEGRIRRDSGGLLSRA